MTTVIDHLSAVPHAAPAPRGILVDRIRPDDRDAVQLLFAACSPQTVEHRFRARLPAFPADYLDALLAGPARVHDALVVRADATGELLALGSLASAHGGEPGVAEIGLLVQDDWQRRGLGRALTVALVERARGRGVTQVVAEVPHGRGGLLGALGRELDTVRRTAHRDGLTGAFRIPAATPTSIGLTP